MPLDPNDVLTAVADQHAAARATALAVRLVAGPGTGKSATIEERVRWLLDQGVPPDSIYVVSFTRASATELRDRVRRYCSQNHVPSGEDVSVTTLHSLALRVLKRAGMLAAYAAGPMVLDDWELRHVFDAEFSTAAGATPGRSADIRREHEAFWSTGNWNPPNWIPPDPAITATERTRFTHFYRPRTQTYSCVLPGEIVRAAVDHTQAGTLDPQDLLEAQHLIVDEFQDLNPADLEFVDHLTRLGVVTFVAGDDDQSIYSFRFADPGGIQNFVAAHGGSADHELRGCFRCTPTVLTAARNLISQNALQSQIPKHLVSLYASAQPPVDGHFNLWRFDTHRQEAAAIAESCSRLIAEGVQPREILILLSDRNALARELTNALDAAGLQYESPNIESLKDADEGRAILSLLRVICDADDYVALRVLLGLLPGVGIGTCNHIAENVIASNLNFKDLFFQTLPTAVFSARETTAITRVRNMTLALGGWSPTDTVRDRGGDISQMLLTAFGQSTADEWHSLVAQIPDLATLEEVRDLVWSDSEELQAAAELAIYERLALHPPETALVPDKIRVMTMHRAKGLSARVVIVPGLEEEVFPGERRGRYPGLVLEAARLLYVSITRGRASVLVTYARRRTRFGTFQSHAPSRFVGDLGCPVEQRTQGLTIAEAAAIAQTCAEL